MTRQAVVFIHGVGEQEKGYSSTCERAIKKQLGKEAKALQCPKPTVEFREIFWANIVSTPQRKLLGQVNKTRSLEWAKLRRLFVSVVGDAIVYRKSDSGEGCYKEIHKRLEEKISSIRKKSSDDDKIEFTFVAHSLGSVILSNYLYDTAKKAENDNTQKLTATNLFTLGSPLALWLLVCGDLDSAKEPIKVAAKHGVWINILDDDDILAYPLRDINDEYKGAVDMDYVTNIGQWLSMWNPGSHFGYWGDGNVVKPIARKLVLDAQRLAERAKFAKEEYLAYIRSLWNI